MINFLNTIQNIKQIKYRRIFDNLMNHCKSFWVAKILDAKQNERFKQNCLIFYKDKTLERVQLFYNNFFEYYPEYKANKI
jgi:hypothetical protein